MKRNEPTPENPELPPGFPEACEKYPDWDIDSLEQIWDLLDVWHEFEKGNPRHKSKVPPGIWQFGMERASEDIANFKERILKAVHDRDLVYLGKLIKAMKLPSRPKPEINAYRALIEAFGDLFIDGAHATREEWPTKQMVRQRAEEILKQAGLPPVSPRHWPRAFKQAGLSALPAGGYNRPP